MKRKKSHIEKTVRVIVFLIIILLTFKIIVFVRGQYFESKWISQSNFAVAISGSDNLLAIWSLPQKSVTLIKISDDTMMKNGPFEGKYSLLAIKKLGEIDQKQKKYFIDALERFFGIRISAFLSNSKLSFNNFDLKLTDVLNEKTDLTIFDYFKIKSQPYVFKKINLHEDVLFSNSKINGESTIIFENKDLDQALRSIFRDQYFSDKMFFVKIEYQNENRLKLEYYKRLVENIGWKLSDVEYAPENTVKKKNQCLIRSEIKQIKFIDQLLDCQMRVDDSINYDLEIQI
jgi:hypothetical protein